MTKCGAVFIAVFATAFGAACGNVVGEGPGGGGHEGGSAGAGGGTNTGGTANTGGSTTTSTSSTTMSNGTINTGSAGGGGNGPCDSGAADQDADGDGFAEVDGDCNDCEPNQNPGAVEVVVTEPGGGEPLDEDCDGIIDEPDDTCDTGLALDNADPMDGARAIDLCQTVTPSDVKWGVLSAAYVRANGTGTPDPLQRGIKNEFGPNVHPQGGAKLLVLSNGRARAVNDPNPCGTISCAMTSVGEAPPSFPQEVPGCAATTDIYDDVALELKIRVPKNVNAYSIDSKFYSFEYPSWVCTVFNDQFVAIVSPPPQGSINGNIVFDKLSNPAGVNTEFMGVCDPIGMAQYGLNCQMGCPSAPNPYCPLGTAELSGTGFDVWGTSGESAATPWLRTSAPVLGGSEITVRLAIWDGDDQNLDSTVLLDHWQWIASGSTQKPTTIEIADPK